jgi:CBS domain-containing protein
VTQVRDIMTTTVVCVSASEPVLTAARRMRDLDVGSLPVRGADDVLSGLVTDRDLVIRVLAEGRDPTRTTVGELVRCRPVTVEPVDDIELAAHVMADRQIRRLLVVCGLDVVGIVSQGDLARALPEALTGELVEAVSA